ncbi:MAG: cadmium-translocating P-type ATPase [Clostridia bacterium]|nr:cadmium-translocating P-type ATPase [Clostridia bacterium]
MIIRISISICLIIVALIVNGFNEYVSMALYLVAYVLNAYKVIWSAIRKLFKNGEVGEKMLMTIASLGAIITESFFEAAFVMALYLIGELIEDGASDHARGSVEALCELRPTKARLKDEKDFVKVEKVKAGDIIEVYAGERIPLDGVILEGYADIDTSVVSGESVPVAMRAGSEVYAGHLDINGALTIKVTRESSQSMVQRIIDISLDASSKKSKSEAFIKKFAKIYTPCVIGVALLVAILPALFGADTFTWLYKAFSLLAISCPCAIVISVPLAYFSAIGYASRKGILIKGSGVLEKLSTLNTMAFDKTGTLTKSELRVTKVETIGEITKMELLELLGIVEKKSNHPVAMAVQREVERFKLTTEEGTGYKERLGLGIECNSSKGHIKAGNYEYAGGDEQFSGATVYVSLNGEFIGYVGIGDSIKENGKISFDKLRANGVEKIYVISGDKQSKVDAIASTLYADGAYSQLLPEHKLDALEDIIASGENVKIGYCGDGINDLPCLSRADIGITIGALSSDAAMEKSDVVIVDDDLEKVPKAMSIAKNTKKRVITNIVFAISAKLLIAILNIVVPGFPMIIAVLADVGVMLIAILNALRAGRKSRLK